MGRGDAAVAERLPRYGDREDEVRRSKDRDEEAQLLDGEDYEQYELDDVSKYALRGRSHVADAAESRRESGRRLPGFLSWLQGPSPLRVHTIRPLVPSIQEYPIRMLDKILPHGWQRLVLLVFFLVTWFFAIAVPLAKSKGALRDSAGYVVRHLNCTDTLWRPNIECGLNGVDCRPFSNESFTFRCPADCANTQVRNPHYVGPLDANNQALIIGGPVYRGDSFLCGSAVHAGVIDNATGGCGIITLVGRYYGYFSTQQNGIESIGFDSHFPLSFTVTKDPNLHCPNTNPQRSLLPVSVFFTITLALFTTSPPVLFFTTFISTFSHIGLLCSSPSLSGPSNTILPTLVSTFAGRLLPALFCAAILYFVSARRTLTNLSAQLEKVLLWLVPFWLGALGNIWIPFSAQDVAQHPYAKPALALGVLLFVVAAAVQGYYLCLEGRLLPYLSLNALFGFTLAFLATVLPSVGLELRMHGYIIALLLLPGTKMQTRPSLIFQGLLLGLFINSIARHGFESPLQLATALKGNTSLTSSMLPEIVAPLVLTDGLETWEISFKWTALPEGLESEGVEGISVLVNDVERYRGFSGDQGRLEEQVFTWYRDSKEVVAVEYFRFGFVGAAGRVGGYTEAGSWFGNGTWSRGEGYYKL